MEKINPDVLEKLRYDARVSPSDLAKAIGTSPATISRYLSGDTKHATDDMFSKMAEFFGKSAEELNWMMLTGNFNGKEEDEMRERIKELERHNADLRTQNDRLYEQLQLANRRIEKLDAELESKKAIPHCDPLNSPAEANH